MSAKSPASGRSRKSVLKPNNGDKNQTTLKKFFNVVSKDEEQEKLKAKEGLKTDEKENGGDTKENNKSVSDQHGKENEADTKENDKSGPSLKQEMKELEKENEGDTEDGGYVKVFRKWHTCTIFPHIFSFRP